MDKQLYKVMPYSGKWYEVKSKEEIENIYADVNINNLILEFFRNNGVEWRGNEWKLHIYIDITDGSVNVEDVFETNSYSPYTVFKYTLVYENLSGITDAAVTSAMNEIAHRIPEDKAKSICKDLNISVSSLEEYIEDGYVDEGEFLSVLSVSDHIQDEKDYINLLHKYGVLEWAYVDYVFSVIESVIYDAEIDPADNLDDIYEDVFYEDEEGEKQYPYFT